jgi:hypothetical protein
MFLLLIYCYIFIANRDCIEVCKNFFRAHDIGNDVLATILLKLKVGVDKWTKTLKAAMTKELVDAVHQSYYCVRYPNWNFEEEDSEEDDSESDP